MFSPKSVLTVLIIVFNLNLAGQATVDVTKAGKYFMDGKRLKMKDLRNLYTTPSTLPDWQIAEKAKRGSDWFGFFGGFGLGWAAAYAVNPPDYTNARLSPQEKKRKKNTARGIAAVMLGTGIVSSIVSIPYTKRFKKHSYAAAVNYNKDLKSSSMMIPYFQLGSTESVFSLSYNF